LVCYGGTGSQADLAGHSGMLALLYAGDRFADLLQFVAEHLLDCPAQGNPRISCAKLNGSRQRLAFMQ
jgi:hypothetical protein